MNQYEMISGVLETALDRAYWELVRLKPEVPTYEYHLALASVENALEILRGLRND